MEKFRYKVITCHNKDMLTRDLGLYGDVGWRVVSVTEQSGGFVVVLERAIR